MPPHASSPGSGDRAVLQLLPAGAEGAGLRGLLQPQVARQDHVRVGPQTRGRMCGVLQDGEVSRCIIHYFPLLWCVCSNQWRPGSLGYSKSVFSVVTQSVMKLYVYFRCYSFHKLV